MVLSSHRIVHLGNKKDSFTKNFALLRKKFLDLKIKLKTLLATPSWSVKVLNRELTIWLYIRLPLLLNRQTHLFLLFFLFAMLPNFISPGAFIASVCCWIDLSLIQVFSFHLSLSLSLSVSVSLSLSLSLSLSKIL